MTIKRTINGIEHEIELTSEEMFHAYCEKQHEYDQDDIMDYLPVYLENNKDGYTEEQIMKKLPEIAVMYRKDLNYLDWWDCALYAIQECMRES